MKRVFVLLVILFSVGFSKDLTELGSEAYKKGDYQKAAELYQKACDSGEARGCSNLGVLYDEGQGVKQDYQKAAQLYQKGCDEGNSLGCFNLGLLYKEGQGVKQDYQKAAQLYQKVCEGGELRGCFNLGVALT